MAKSVEQIEAELLNLPSRERARLAEVLISSLDEDAEVEQAWSEEVARRAEELRSGKVKPVPAQEVFEELRGRLR
jgi:putative addiction module component (TIGR02574 family)